MQMKTNLNDSDSISLTLEDETLTETGYLTSTEENKLRAAEYAQQILSGHSSSKLAELNYLDDLFERKENIAKRAEENHRHAQLMINEKINDTKQLEQRIQETESMHGREMNHLSEVQNKLTLEANMAISIAAQKKRDEQRAKENINKAILAYQNLMVNLHNLKKSSDIELDKAQKLVNKTQKEALVQREAAEKAKLAAHALRQQLNAAKN